MKYDIFISYRRKGGYETAKHLFDLLSRDGYSVSFDIDTLRSGDFDVEIYKRIDECNDFILIVAPNTFDKTLDASVDKNQDWVRCEIEYALKTSKNIVPVFLDGISSFPDNLPEDIKSVSKRNGPLYDNYYFDAFYEKLKSDFLLSKAYESEERFNMGVRPYIEEKDYKSAYYYCLDCINKKMDITYAQSKANELLPLIKKQAQKEVLKNTLKFLISAIVIGGAIIIYAIFSNYIYN